MLPCRSWSGRKGAFGSANGSRADLQRLSDLSVRIDHLIGEADKVVARFTLTGVHSGDFQGVPATGRPVTFAATDIYRFEDGQIVEGWA